MAVEVEIRSFISQDEYRQLRDFFTKHAEFKGDDEQVTYYFDGKDDLRIQKNKTNSKIVLKKGAMHAEARDEFEVSCPREEFERLEKLFAALGYAVRIKWFRTRHSFDWEDIIVTLDYTKGYGYIIELEKVCDFKEKEAVLNVLRQKLASLKVKQTSKEEFDKKFHHYKENWKSLVGEK